MLVIFYFFPRKKILPEDGRRHLGHLQLERAGVLFRVLAVPDYAIHQLEEHYHGQAIDAIATAEARGFLFSAPMALHMSKPLIPLRKPGKLPYRTYSLKYELEYGSAELHVHEDVIGPGSRVLLVDDLLATGGTMQAGCKLIEKAGGRVAGCAFLVELTFLHGREKLEPHEVFSLIQY